MKLKTDEDIQEFVVDAIQRSSSATDEWRKEAITLYDYVAGHQWTEQESAALKANGKIPIVYNRMDPFVDAVSGLEALNRQECKYIARVEGQQGKQADILNAGAKAVRDSCDAEDEESEAFRDALICGMGWTDTRYDQERDPDGELVIERIDPIEMFWDPLARKKNLEDARWVARVQKVDKGVIEDMWPDVDPDEGTQTPEPPEAGSMTTAADSAWMYSDDLGDDEVDANKRVIITLQWYQLENVYYVTTDRGVQRYSTDQWAEMKDAVAANGWPFRKLMQRAYRRAFIVGKQVKEVQDNPCTEGFTFKAITGKRDRKKNVWYGIARAMQSPQQWANKFFSQVLFEMVTGGKGILAERNSFANLQAAKEQWAQSDEIVLTEPGAVSGGKIMPKPGAQINPATDRMMQYSIAAFRDVTGVNLEMMGLADRNQAGVLEQQRKQAGITIVAWAFDSLRRYRKDQGRLLAYMIREYIADGRLVPMIGESAMEYVPMFRDDLKFKYDIAVDDAPSSPSQKERTWLLLADLLPHLMNLGIPIPKELIDYIPLPQSLIEKWKQQMAPQKTPEQQKMEQAQARAVEADVAKKEGDAQLSKAKAATEMAKARKEGLAGGIAMNSAAHQRMLEESRLRSENDQRAAQTRKTNIEALKLIGEPNGGTSGKPAGKRTKPDR